MTPELAPPLLTTTPHQREDVSALDRFNVHRCPTRRVFSGTELKLVTRKATVRYLYHSATAATFPSGIEQINRLEYIKLYGRNSNLGHHTGQANAVQGINADQIRCSQLASLDKNNALQEIKLRLSYLQGKSTTMSVIAHQTEKEWISANEKSRQRMSQTQAEGAAKQHAARLEEAHLRAHHSCFTSERC
ncbi:uncharacterized protein TNCV_3765781 [Trichonephila clavipes]|nr:uncharacterized protein TNCV_3765781 [Trichonephila clavipes]